MEGGINLNLGNFTNISDDRGVIGIIFQHSGASLMGTLLAIATRIFLLTVISDLGNTAPDNVLAEDIKAFASGKE